MRQARYAAHGLAALMRQARKNRNMRTAEQMIATEVYCCVTHLVTEVLGVEGSELADDFQTELSEAKDRAENERVLELIGGAVPYGAEETAVAENIAEYRADNDGLDPEPGDLYESLDLDYPEVYEWWVVSDWLSKKLAARGEIVLYQGVDLWGRQCSGQGIALDSVIQAIHRGMVKA